MARTRFHDRSGGLTDVLSGKVGTFCATAQDDVQVLIPTRLDDGRNALFRNAHKRVRVAARAHRVDGDGHAAVRAVLEADGEGHARGELAVELGLGGARADRAPRDEVVEVLWGNGVEELKADGDAEMSEVA